MSKQDLLDMLSAYELHLKADGLDKTAMSVSNARSSIMQRQNIPGNPSEIDGVGEHLRDVIADYQFLGYVEELEELRDKRPYLEELCEVEGLGPARAVAIHEELGIENVSELIDAPLTDVHGIGDTTAQKIKHGARVKKAMYGDQ